MPQRVGVNRVCRCPANFLSIRCRMKSAAPLPIICLVLLLQCTSAWYLPTARRTPAVRDSSGAVGGLSAPLLSSHRCAPILAVEKDEIDAAWLEVNACKAKVKDAESEANKAKATAEQAQKAADAAWEICRQAIAIEDAKDNNKGMGKAAAAYKGLRKGKAEFCEAAFQARLLEDRVTAALANTKAARDEASDATRVAQRLEAERAAIATGRTAVAGAAAAVKGFKWAAAAASGDAEDIAELQIKAAATAERSAKLQEDMARWQKEVDKYSDARDSGAKEARNYLKETSAKAVEALAAAESAAAELALAEAEAVNKAASAAASAVGKTAENVIFGTLFGPPKDQARAADKV